MEGIRGYQKKTDEDGEDGKKRLEVARWRMENRGGRQRKCVCGERVGDGLAAPEVEPQAGGDHELDAE